MKKTIFTLVVSAAFGMYVQAQQVLFEQEYTRNILTPTDVTSFPIKDGGVFMAYCKSPKVSPKPSQVLVAFDKEKKKLFEFATADVVEFKNKKLDFLYNESNQKIYGIYCYEKKGAAFADIMMLNMAGSYTVKASIPTALHVVSCFIYNNDIVLLGLTSENKVGGLTTDKVPSGSYEATIVKGDVTSYSSQKLTLPSYTADKNIVHNRLVDVDGANLYFVTETKSEAITNKLTLTYEFTQYDFANHKIVATKSTTVDMGDNSYRSSTMSNTDRVDLTHTDQVGIFMPDMVYNKTEKAFFATGSYGKGYPVDEALRKYEGSFVLRFNRSFDLEWKSFIKTGTDAAANPTFSDAKSKHSLGLHWIKGTTYLTVNSDFDGKVSSEVHSVDSRTGNASMVQTGTNRAEKLLLDKVNPTEAKNAASLQDTEGLAVYIVPVGASNYVVTNNTTRNKVFIYRF